MFRKIFTNRTNAAQLCIGVAALGEQLYAMGLTASPLLEFRSHLVALVLALYEEMGDAIAVQLRILFFVISLSVSHQ